MTALYSLRSTDSPSNWRITKFNDGDVEASYLVSDRECDCPAGHRHTCRHRQMLPTMLAHKLADSMWFFAFDTGGQIVDFNGTSKHLLDQLADCRPAEQETAKDTLVGDIINPKTSGIPHLGGVYAKDVTPERSTFTIPDGYEAIRDADGRATGEVRPVPAGQHPQLIEPKTRTPLPPQSWRRL